MNITTPPQEGNYGILGPTTKIFHYANFLDSLPGCVYGRPIHRAITRPDRFRLDRVMPRSNLLYFGVSVLAMVCYASWHNPICNDVSYTRMVFSYFYSACCILAHSLPVWCMTVLPVGRILIVILFCQFHYWYWSHLCMHHAGYANSYIVPLNLMQNTAKGAKTCGCVQNRTGMFSAEGASIAYSTLFQSIAPK